METTEAQALIANSECLSSLNGPFIALALSLFFFFFKSLFFSFLPFSCIPLLSLL